MSGSALPFIARKSLGVDGGVEKTSFSAPGLCMLVDVGFGKRWIATDMWLAGGEARRGMISQLAFAPDGHLALLYFPISSLPIVKQPAADNGYRKPCVRACTSSYLPLRPRTCLLMIGFQCPSSCPTNRQPFPHLRLITVSRLQAARSSRLLDNVTAALRSKEICYEAAHWYQWQRCEARI